MVIFFAKIAWREMVGAWRIAFELCLLTSLVVVTSHTLYYVSGSLKIPNQFIELRNNTIYWQIFPIGIGELPYTQIRFVGLSYDSNRGRISNGKLHLCYQPLGQPENGHSWQNMTLNLYDICYPHQLRFSGNPYLQTITKLQQETIKRIPPEQLITELEWEKWKTRVWLDSFKDKR